MRTYPNTKVEGKRMERLPGWIWARLGDVCEINPQKVKWVKEETEQIIQTTLRKVFSRAQEEGWEWTEIGRLVDYFQSGFACSKKTRSRRRNSTFTTT